MKLWFKRSQNTKEYAPNEGGIDALLGGGGVCVADAISPGAFSVFLRMRHRSNSQVSQESKIKRLQYLGIVAIFSLSLLTHTYAFLEQHLIKTILMPAVLVVSGLFYDTVWGQSPDKNPQGTPPATENKSSSEAQQGNPPPSPSASSPSSPSTADGQNNPTTPPPSGSSASTAPNASNAVAPSSPAGISPSPSPEPNATNSQSSGPASLSQGTAGQGENGTAGSTTGLSSGQSATLNKSTKATPTAGGERKAEDANRFDPLSLDQTRVKILLSLNDREKELKEWEKMLQARENYVKSLEVQLKHKAKELSELKVTIEALAKANNQYAEDNLKKVVKIYEDMKPPAAGKILEGLPQSVLVSIIKSMKQKNAAAILAIMDQEKVRALTNILAMIPMVPEKK